MAVGAPSARFPLAEPDDPLAQLILRLRYDISVAHWDVHARVRTHPCRSPERDAVLSALAALRTLVSTPSSPGTSCDAPLCRALLSKYKLMDQLVRLSARMSQDDVVLQQCSELISALSGEATRPPVVLEEQVGPYRFRIREMSYLEVGVGFKVARARCHPFTHRRHGLPLVCSTKCCSMARFLWQERSYWNLVAEQALQRYPAKPTYLVFSLSRCRFSHFTDTVREAGSFSDWYAASTLS
jgi:hypothetical protein